MSDILTEGGTWVQMQSTVSAGLQKGSITRRWQGLREDMESLVDLLGVVDAGYDYSLSPTTGPCAELSVTYPTGIDRTVIKPSSILTTEWQLQGHSAMVPKTEHPKAITAIDELTKKSATAAETFAQIYNGQIAWSNRGASYDASVALCSVTSQLVLTRLLRDKWHGRESVYRGEPVLVVVDRFTGIAPWGVDTANVNIVYKRDKLIGALRKRKTNRIPNHIVAKIREGDWLCESVDVMSSSDGSRTNSQSFRWAPQWDTFWYDYA